jgi:hypothetical protein
MRLDQLRARLLLAIPVTLGCGAKAPKVEAPDDDDREPVEPRAAEPTPVRKVEPVADRPSDPAAIYARFPPPHRADRCALHPDTVFEQVCGNRHAGNGECQPTADRLSTDEATHATLYVTGYGPHALEEFRFDLDATDRYRMAHDGHGCCYVHCTTMEVSTAAVAPLVGRNRYTTVYKDLPVPPAGTKAGKSYAQCPETVKIEGTARALRSATQTKCSYAVGVIDGEPIPGTGKIRGRPARIDGAAHVVGVVDGNWTTLHEPIARTRPATSALDPVAATTRAALDPGSLDPAIRARLAAVWLEAARMEHASIAAFSNLALQLLVHGAPPELVEATHAAALDEIRHAREAFAIASRYAGRTLGPAPFTAAARMTADVTLAQLALETFIDGCIGETCAAVEAARAAEAASDRDLATTLRAISEDETRHAELAWAIVAWCVSAQPALLVELRARLAREHAMTPHAGDDPATHDMLGDLVGGRMLGDAATTRLATHHMQPHEDLATHGVLGEAALARVRTDVLAIVADCLAALADRAAA